MRLPAPGTPLHKTGCRIDPVAVTNAPKPPDATAVQAARIIENMVGNAWATDQTGKFLYVTAAALVHFGATLDGLNAPTDDGSFSWRRVIHPDDYRPPSSADLIENAPFSE
jgi:hypothetical protein